MIFLLLWVGQSREPILFQLSGDALLDLILDILNDCDIVCVEIWSKTETSVPVEISLELAVLFFVNEVYGKWGTEFDEILLVKFDSPFPYKQIPVNVSIKMVNEHKIVAPWNRVIISDYQVLRSVGFVILPNDDIIVLIKLLFDLLKATMCRVNNIVQCDGVLLLCVKCLQLYN